MRNVNNIGFLEDFEYLYLVLKQNLDVYSEFMIDKLKYYSLSEELKIESLKKIKDITSENEFVSVVNGFLENIKDGHTKIDNVIKKEEKYIYPLILKYVKGDYYVSYDNKYNLKYNKVLNINGENIDEYIKKINSNDAFLYDHKREKEYKAILMIKAKEKSEILNLEFEDKKIDINPQDENEFKKDWIKSIEEKYKNEHEPIGNVKFNILDKVAYIRVNSFNEGFVKKDENFFSDHISEKLEKNNIKDVIIDIRGNKGGTDEYYQNFSYLSNTDILYRENISFSKNDKSEVIEQGKIEAKTTRLLNKYLLVDGETYSSADGFAKLCKYKKWAKVIGTTTAGDGIGLTPKKYILPNTKIEIKISNGHPEDMNKFYTEPDMYIENESKELDYYGDIKEDNVLNSVILEINKNREKNIDIEK